MDGQSTTSRLGNALATYRSIVDGQIQSVEELETWLKHRSASNRVYETIASSLYSFLASNKDKLLEAKRAPTSSYPSASSSWGPISWTRTSAATVTVTGAGGDRHGAFELQTDGDTDIDSIESFLGVLQNSFDNIAATEVQLSRLAELIGVMESSALSGSPAETVHDHIQLLGQYNDAKDIAQQLIGLIADNRGVPVGTLYQHDQYGVGPED
ncbi:Swi5-domain-containing protein [Coniochaeta sp. 2T2.1]|nr:Swi5-domain-containing protein [Coniochaeta sp. 2T2.1]